MISSLNLTLIAAMDENRLIGGDNKLPWHIPADLNAFKQNTMGKTLLMGRKTCESLPFALPERDNIVLSRNPDFERSGFSTITMLDELPSKEEIILIGGAKMYQWLLPYCNKMILTHIHAAFRGDAYFPDFSQQDWQVVAKTNYPINDQNPKYEFDLVHYQRIK